MGFTSGRFVRFQNSVLSTTPLLAAAALFAAACSGEPTNAGTDPAVDEPIEAFVTAPEDVAAAGAVALLASHSLPTVERRVSSASFSEVHTNPVNSPFDLTYFGGPVLNSAKSFNLYVNCADGPLACWGSQSLTPGTFLRDLNHDNFIQLVNEFIHSDAKGQFPVAEMSTTATFANNTATINDVLGIVLSAVNHTRETGYTAIYHVFLPQGTDMCIDATTCYSPDNFDTFVFCAFHSSVDFGGNRHVLFSVEPYQATPGCELPGQTPHGAIDATASTLSHELLETITDPDGNAWFNGLFGFENADTCSLFGSNQRIGANDYFVQSEYSNIKHACIARI